MPDFNSVEDTLFVPMLGRIYASENFPNILMDAKALELKNKLPKNLKGEKTQTQYSFLASAVRSTNMDRAIADFLSRKPDGIIAQLGCGLETTFFRNDNGRTIWYEIDLPDVIAYRSSLLPGPDRDRAIAADAFESGWIKKIRSHHPAAPILVTASGLFYYFKEAAVLNLLQELQNYGDVELIFDTVNKSGMKRMATKYLKQVGHEDAAMFFYVDSAQALAHKIGGQANVLREEAYYTHTAKAGLKIATSVSMRVSDLLMMVKMVHLALGCTGKKSM